MATLFLQQKQGNVRGIFAVVLLALIPFVYIIATSTRTMSHHMAIFISAPFIKHFHVAYGTYQFIYRQHICNKCLGGTHEMIIVTW